MTMPKIERKPLLTVEQFKQLARPTSTHLDEDDVEKFIRECEDAFILPAIGWANFKASIGLCPWDNTFDDSFVPDLFLDGGEWDTKERDEDGNEFKKLRYCNGVRKAVAYFTYAKLLRADGTIISRAGWMRHRDEYSDHVQDITNNKQYNDIMGLAEGYLSDCLYYLKYHAKSKQISPVRGSRAHVHAIGD
jgi:hypothetical protein